MDAKTGYKFGVSVVLIAVIAALVAIQRVPWEAGLGILVAIGAAWQVIKRTRAPAALQSLLDR